MEKTNIRDRSFRNARSIDVLLQDHYGGFAQHPPARDVRNHFHSCFSGQSSYSYLRQRFFDGALWRFQSLVDAIPLYLDHTLGDCYADTEKNT